MNDCSVLISSCDKYEDAWMPFFHFFKKNWETCPFPIYLNTETKSYNDPDLYISPLNYAYGGAISWSKRLKLALKRIHTEYVIFLLEDFFLLSPVNQKEIERCIDIMNQDKNISVIDWEYVQRIKTIPSPYEGYAYRDRSAMYFLNCQSAIWRRKDLIRFLSPYEDAWQFELYGSARARLSKKDFLTQSYPRKIFDYDLSVKYGYGINRGKWLPSNIKLFAENDIAVDFGKLGIYHGDGSYPHCLPPRKCIRERLWYLLYGGFEEYDNRVRISIPEQISIFFHHPRKFLCACKNKMIFIFTDVSANSG